MFECPGCHRHVHATESSCPFCAAPLATTSAASLATMPMVAFAAGLSLLACTESSDDAGESNAVTTDPSTSESTSTSTSGDGDGDTQETLDYGGSDYGGAPPCDELFDAIPLSVGNNSVDTAMAGNDFVTSCGGEFGVGTGPDRLLEFTSPADGSFTFAVAAEFDAWLLMSGYYCGAYSEDGCVPNQALDIELVEGETLYLILDGPTDAGGTVSVDVTQG